MTPARSSTRPPIPSDSWRRSRRPTPEPCSASGSSRRTPRAPR